MSRARTSAAARRRSQPSLLARVRVMWIVLLFSGITAAAAAYAAAGWEGFHPKVQARGSEHITAAEIVRAGGIDEHANLWLQSTSAIRRRIEALPYVAAAQVVRTLPATVQLSVSERRPVAFVQVLDGYALIDADQRVLQRGLALSNALPLLDGPPLRAVAGAFVQSAQIARLLRDLTVLDGEKLKVRSLAFERFGELVGTVPGGVRIRFGSDADLPAKCRLVEPIVRTIGGRLGKVAAIDLRAPKTPVVEYR